MSLLLFFSFGFQINWIWSNLIQNIWRVCGTWKFFYLKALICTLNTVSIPQYLHFPLLKFQTNHSLTVDYCKFSKKLFICMVSIIYFPMHYVYLNLIWKCKNVQKQIPDGLRFSVCNIFKPTQYITRWLK